MLGQFNGILRYANGKYELDIKTGAPRDSDNPDVPDLNFYVPGVDNISEADIIGSIKIDDKGQKNSYNSIAANIIDPHNKFGSISISYFDSNYLKEDKGIPRQGTYALPGISNYYTARTNIVQYLKESRYGLNISFTMDPKGYLLKAGNVIIISYDRFNWSYKEFRIKSLTLQPDGKVAIIAREHNNDAFLIDYLDRTGMGFGGDSNKGGVPLDPPTDLTATQDLRGEIQLNWINSEQYRPIDFQIEIYAVEATKDSSGTYYTDSGGYLGNNWASRELLDWTAGNRYVHAGLGADDLHVWFYWIRYALPSLFKREYPRYSPYEPIKTEPGVEGQAVSDATLDALTVVMSNENHTFAANKAGEIITYDGSGTTIQFMEGATPLVYDLNRGETDPGTWNFETVDDIDITVGAYAGDGPGTTLIVQDHSNMIDEQATISYTISGTRFQGEDIDNIGKAQSFSKVSTGADGDQGSDGVDAKAVKLSAESYVIVYDEDEINPVPSGNMTLTATSQQVAVPYYKFMGDGFQDQGNYSAADTLPWPIPDNYYTTPRSIRVDVSEESTTGPSLAFDNITIAAVHPGLDGSIGSDSRSVILSTTTLAITYDSAGESPSPSGNLLITADAHNTTGTPYYRFLLNDNEELDDDSPTWNYPIPINITAYPQKIEVELREGGPYGGGGGPPILATDQINIFPLHYGSDAITVIVSNAAHTLPVTNLGVVDYTGSGTTIKVYEGAFLLYYDADGTTNNRTWGFANIDDVNITVGAPDPTDGYGGGNEVTPGVWEWAEIPDATNMTASLASITFEITGKRFEGEAVSIDQYQSLSQSVDGSDGGTGRGVKLTAPAMVYQYDETGQNPTSPVQEGDGTMEITANPYNTGSAPEDQFFEFLINDAPVSPPQNSNNPIFYYPPTDNFGDMPEKVTVQYREDSDSADVLAIDEITMFGLIDVVDGVDAITIILTNESHGIPADDNGENPIMDGSGTKIRVFDGIDELTWKFDNTPALTAGQWTVAVAGTNITTAAIVEFTNPIAYGLGAEIKEHTDMDDAENTGYVTYTITGKRSDGTSLGSIEKIQSLSKSKRGVQGADGADGSAGDEGVTVRLTANTLAFAYDAEDANPNPAGPITVTANDYGITGTPFYKFYTTLPGQSAVLYVDPPYTSQTYSYTPEDDIVDMPVIVEVEVMEDAADNPILARDQINMVPLQFGSDGVTIVVGNEAHTIRSDADGTTYGPADYVGSGTTIKAWIGQTDLTYDPTPAYDQPSFRVTAVPDVGVTPASPSGSGSKTCTYGPITAFPSGSDLAQIRFDITIVDAKGAEEVYPKYQSFSKSKGGVDGISPTATVVVVMTNEAHTISADEEGDPYNFTGSGTKIRVFEGNTELDGTGNITTDEEWGVSVLTESGVVADSSPDYSGGGKEAEFGPITAMAADSGYIDYRIQGQMADSTTIDITKRMSFSKSKKGDFGGLPETARLDSDTYAIKYDENGDPTTANYTLTATAQGFTDPQFRIYDYDNIGSDEGGYSDGNIDNETY